MHSWHTHCWGFPCSVCFPVHACRHQYPDRSNGPIRSYCSVSFGLPRYFGGSAPVLTVSGPAQCLLTLQPAYSRSRLNGPLHRRLRRFCCLHRRFDCYWVERTSSQVGLSPTEKHRLVTAHVGSRTGALMLGSGGHSFAFAQDLSPATMITVE